MDTSSGQPTILVVDDHHDAADALSRLLRKCGHATEVAYGGHEALAYLAGHEPPAVIVLDLWMPRTDGRAVLRHVTRDPRLRRVPVVVYSADVTPEMLRTALELGAIDYVVKGTLGWRELCDRVLSHVENGPPVPAGA
jgi:CheY-like chemotaxis protein